MTEEWRLLIDGPAPGAWNMAVDEAIFRAVEASPGPPTLRLYRWAPPAVSLGFGQSSASSVNPDLLAAEGIDLVRRPTAGKAVLHDDEVTYSLAARHGAFPGWQDLLEVYRTVTEAFAVGLGKLGLAAALVPRKPGSLRARTPVCFAVPASYELMVDGRKVLGSAQRRSRSAFLQHGSLPLTLDLALLYRCLHPEEKEEGREDALIARWRGEMAGLGEVAGRRLDWETVASALVQGVEGHLGVTLKEGKLSLEESALAESLAAEKYADPAWTHRR
ncbi:MAG: lipoate--protein ligase family protein [Nitrospinae bacterium]|nr:lipoate--protein ligase family protein [Nitrospinota bacterium]